MFIRKYRSTDCPHLIDLFYNTVHSVNARNYTQEQLNAWAPQKTADETWNQKFLSQFTIVAIKNNTIVGFGSIDQKGYIDMLFTHKDYQKQGIAKAICEKLETEFPVSRIITHASVTAKPFFEKRGYQTVKEQKIQRNQIALSNYLMEKMK